MKNSIKNFEFYLKNQKKLSKNSIISYINDIKKLKEFLESKYKITEFKKIENIHIASYFKDIIKKTENTTYARKFTSIKQYFEFLKKEENFKIDLMEKLSIPKIKNKIPNVLSLKEVQNIISVIKKDKLYQRNISLIELIYGSGLRISEALNIEMKNLNLNKNYIVIKGKGDKERIVPIQEITKNVLTKYIEELRNEILEKNKIKTPHLFLNRSGEKLTRQGFHKIIKKWQKLAQIEKEISAHTLRHSFATHMLENGIDLKTLQTILGHEDISTTQIYTHISQIHLKEIYSKTHPTLDVKT